MKYSRTMCASLALLLSACDMPAPQGTTEPATASEAPMVLKCTGHEIDVSNAQRTPKTHLISVSPTGESLSYYDFEKFGWFTQACGVGRKQCQLFVSRGAIEEDVFLAADGENRHIGIRSTYINRVTGEMKMWIPDSNFGDRPLFDGICVKSEAPPMQPQKF